MIQTSRSHTWTTHARSSPDNNTLLPGEDTANSYVSEHQRQSCRPPICLWRYPLHTAARANTPRRALHQPQSWGTVYAISPTHPPHRIRTDALAVSLVTPVTSAAPLVPSAHTIARRGMHNPIVSMPHISILICDQSFREGPPARQHPYRRQASPPRPHPWW